MQQGDLGGVVDSSMEAWPPVSTQNNVQGVENKTVHSVMPVYHRSPTPEYSVPF